MSNLIQESVELQNPEGLYDPFDSRFSMLCLNGAISSPTVDGGGHCHHPRPASCGCREGRLTSATISIPMKRRSPTPSYATQDPITSSYTEPKPKKLFLDQEDNVTGFSRIDLPIPFGPSANLATQVQPQPHSLPPLRRSVSDPTAATFSPSFDYLVDSCPPVNPEQSPNNAKSSAPPLTPLSTKRFCTNSALPPLPPLPLRRTVSEPNPSPEKISGSPNKVEKVNDLIKEDSPDSKRLRRMKDRMKEMNRWWNEVMREQEHEEAEEEDRNARDNNDTKENACEEEIEETVGVERVGDSLELRLKCPCGKGFEILLSGRSCFYKLV